MRKKTKNGFTLFVAAVGDTFTATRAELCRYGGYFESFAVLAFLYRCHSDTYTSRRI